MTVAMADVGGSTYPDAEDKGWGGTPAQIADAWRQHSTGEAARHRELQLGIDAVEDLLRELEIRVQGLASMSGVSTGSPVDGQTATLIATAGTQTRAAVDAAAERAAKGYEPLLLASAFGIKADGATDDTAALVQGLAASARLRRPLRLPLDGRVKVAGKIVLPSGAHLDGHGATLVWPASTGAGSWLMTASSTTGVTVENLTLRTEAPAADVVDQRGFAAVDAYRLTLRNVALESQAAGAAQASINSLGFFLDRCRGLVLERISTSNFCNAVRVRDSDDWTLRGLQVYAYRLGLWISDCRRVHVSDGRIWGKSPVTTQDSGHNGILVDADPDGGTVDLTFEDIVVEDSGATGFRLGGATDMHRISFIRCHSFRAGSNGFKSLGGTLESKTFHHHVRFIDCSVEDCGLGGGDNIAGVAVHLTDDVAISNLRVGRKGDAAGSGFSCGRGVDIAGAKRVIVQNASISYPSMAAIAVRAALGEVSDVRIDGGRFATLNGASCFDIDWRYTTFRRVQITGWPSVEHYGTGYVLYAQSNASSQVVGGITATWMPSSAITNTASGGAEGEVVCDIRGAVPTSMTYTNVADGSRWWGRTSTRAFGLKKSGAWTWL